jgi:cytosine/adenosine deaminase-related metal-dependent hydrolase
VAPGRLRLTARWIVPVCADPIADGAILIENGRIAAAGPATHVPAPADADTQDLGNAAILPGLVNTHTHLELTALRGLVPGVHFPRWVQSIRRIKDRMTPEHFNAGARWGVLEHFSHGITCIGDTGSTGAAIMAMASSGARGVAYHEVFGPDPAQQAASLEGLVDALKEFDQYASERVSSGVSPHAPYTVSHQLVAAVADLAREQGRKVAMHVAESPEERHFIEEGRGPFADHLRGRGIAVAVHGVSPVAWALRAGLEPLRPLFIHCVQADIHDAEAMARCGATAAHCPWSNQELSVGRANLAMLRDAGVTVGLGTDSVAAGNTFDLFNESRLAAMGVALTPRERLALFTMDAADALGIEGAGRIAPGAWADLCAVSLDAPSFAAAHNIEGAIASGTQPSHVRQTWVAGRTVYRNGEWPGVDAAAERSAVERAAAEVRGVIQINV